MEVEKNRFFFKYPFENILLYKELKETIEMSVFKYFQI